MSWDSGLGRVLVKWFGIDSSFLAFLFVSISVYLYFLKKDFFLKKIFVSTDFVLLSAAALDNASTIACVCFVGLGCVLHVLRVLRSSAASAHAPPSRFVRPLSRPCRLGSCSVLVFPVSVCGTVDSGGENVNKDETAQDWMPPPPQKKWNK